MFQIECGPADLWFLRQQVGDFVDLISDFTRPVNPKEAGQWDALEYFIPVDYQCVTRFYLLASTYSP